MKLFIASDLHGSLAAGELMLKRFNDSGATYLILLGDLLNHGPRNMIPAGYDPAKLATLLNQYKQQIIAVRGNCDSEVDQMLLEFPITATFQQILTEKMRFFCTHGHIYKADNLPPLQKNEGFIYGHTHVAVAEYIDNILHFNPGSTTIPRNGASASYGLITDTRCQVIGLNDNRIILSCSLNLTR